MTLSCMQRIGMRIFFIGIAGYLPAVLLVPSMRWLWLALLAMSAIGAVCYVVGTLPGVLAWMKEIRR